MLLRATEPLMESDDYKKRFEAEYYQLKIRYNKLCGMLDLWDKGLLTYEPACPRSTYDLQLGAMKDYLAILEVRAKAEDIRLREVE